MIRHFWLIIKGPSTRKVLTGAAVAFSFLITGSAWAGDIRVANAAGHLSNDRINGHRITVYLDIENSGGSDRLYAVRSEISQNAMVSITGGMHGDKPDAASGGMEMSESRHHRTAALDVPAGRVVRLEKGGSHIMLMNPDQVPMAGATFPITLFFENAGSITVDVTMKSTGFAQQPAH